MSKADVVGLELLTLYMNGEFGEFCASMVAAYFGSLSCDNPIEIKAFEEVTSEIRTLAYKDMLYDRPSSSVVIGGAGFHPGMTAVLFFSHQIYEKKPKAILELDPMIAAISMASRSEQEVTTAYLNMYGLYQSSILHTPTIQLGQDLSLNAQERILFRAYNQQKCVLEHSVEETYSELMKKLLR